MVALPFIMMGMSAAGTAMSMKGQLDAANFQGQVADRNASLAERAAVDAETRGAADAGMVRMKGSQLVGQARAAASGTGLDLMGGNVLDSIGTTRFMSEMDVQTTKNNALREAMGFRAQSDNFRLQGQGARAAGTTGAISSLITGAGRMGSLAYTAWGGGGPEEPPPPEWSSGMGQFADAKYDPDLFPKLGK